MFSKINIARDLLLKDKGYLFNTFIVWAKCLNQFCSVKMFLLIVSLKWTERNYLKSFQHSKLSQVHLVRYQIEDIEVRYMFVPNNPLAIKRSWWKFLRSPLISSSLWFPLILVAPNRLPSKFWVGIKEKQISWLNSNFSSYFHINTSVEGFRI